MNKACAAHFVSILNAPADKDSSGGEVRGSA